ncbi:MAG: ribosome biogenesis GTPase YlqF [Clostridiales bacterium]|nr:ribosome biogenesis GTPase YlqF [Clostridiales bacterium]
MNIQWYPGHMTKAMRAMKADIAMVDVIIELLDARAPFASRNPDIDELGRGKSRVVLLNKADLADDRMNEAWIRYFKNRGFFVLKINAKSGTGMKQILPVVQEACREKIERNRRRGILNRPVRAMVVGIPNVGKSTFINSFVGKSKAKTGNKPGVTRANQWIRINPSLELLDTPGVLWPKFEDPGIGVSLALIGSINDEIVNKEELAFELIRHLCRYAPEGLKRRYDLETGSEEPDIPAMTQILEIIARRRGLLAKGGEPELEKAAGILLDDFRAGRLGTVTLEVPPSGDAA